MDPTLSMMPVPTALRRVSDIYIGLLLSLFLLWTGTGGYETITESKSRMFLILAGAYVVITLILSLELHLVGRWKIPSPKNLWRRSSLTQKLIFAYWVWSGVSTILSQTPAASFFGMGRMEGFLAISLYCLTFLLISAFAKPAKWYLALYGVCISVCCVLALFQLAGYNPFTLYPEGMFYQDGFVLYAGKFLGTIGNIDLLSAVLTLSIPLFWVGVLRLKGKKRFLLLIPLFLCLTVLLTAYVEGGLLGVFLGALLCLPVVLPKKGRRRRNWTIVVIVVLIFCFVFVYFFGGMFSGFVYEAHELLHGRWDEDFGSGRLAIWEMVMPLIGERPLLGGGPDTLGLRNDLTFERFSETLGIMLTSSVDNAHNEYLNIAVNQGLPALILYLFALLTAAGKWVRRSSLNSIVAILGAAMLGYCIQAFFGLSSIISTPYFWLAFALLVGNHHGETSQNTSYRKKTRRKKA